MASALSQSTTACPTILTKHHIYHSNSKSRHRFVDGVAPALRLHERQSQDQDQENGSATAREGQNEDADHLFTSGEICFLSFDIEYGGDCRGIVHQLCSEFAPMVIKEMSNVSNATDKAA
eukprot:scaffold6048_cov90-Cyclotella_meneghiniana.AAC.5